MVHPHYARANALSKVVADAAMAVQRQMRHGIKRVILKGADEEAVPF